MDGQRTKRSLYGSGGLLVVVADGRLDAADLFHRRKDIVGILGQSLGWFIYLRNLSLIYGRGTGREGSADVRGDGDSEPRLKGRDS